MVGVNWAIQVDTRDGYPSGIGYAISINTVKRVVPQLIQTGKFAYPYLGLSTQDNLPLDVINTLGLKSTTGAYVVAGGPRRAGRQSRHKGRDSGNQHSRTLTPAAT